MGERERETAIKSGRKRMRERQREGWREWERESRRGRADEDESGRGR